MVKTVITDKGCLEALGNLPTTGNALGDVYLIKETGLQYYWSRTSSAGFKSDWRILNDPDIDQIVRQFSFPLPYTSLSIQDLTIVPTDRMLVEIGAHIITAFPGVGANLKIGTPGNDDAFLETSETELDINDVFYTKSLKDSGPFTLRATLNAGIPPTAGELLVIVTTAQRP